MKDMESSGQHFSNIQELLRNAIFMKQQLDYNESIRARVRAKQSAQLRSESNQKTNPKTNPMNAFHRFSGSFETSSSILPSLSSSASSDFKELRATLFKQHSQSQNQSSQSSGQTSIEQSQEVDETKRLF